MAANVTVASVAGVLAPAAAVGGGVALTALFIAGFFVLKAKTTERRKRTDALQRRRKRKRSRGTTEGSDVADATRASGETGEGRREAKQKQKRRGTALRGTAESVTEF